VEANASQPTSRTLYLSQIPNSFSSYSDRQVLVLRDGIPFSEDIQAFPALVWRQIAQSCLKCIPPQHQHPPASFRYSFLLSSPLSNVLDLLFPLSFLFRASRRRPANRAVSPLKGVYFSEWPDYFVTLNNVYSITTKNSH
jgi:hypothetical protein